MARQFGCPFVETSAKQRVNVDESFSDLVREVRRFNKEQATMRSGALSSTTTSDYARPATTNNHASAKGDDDGVVTKGMCKGCNIM